MHVLITGAAGFLGRALAQRLVPGSLLGGRTVNRLTLLDLALDGPAPEGVRHCEGDMGDADWLRGALNGGPTIDALFHLASIPGGTAEQDYPLSRRVNLDATQTLLEHGRQQVAAGHAAPVFVFASSIAVFGHLPELDSMAVAGLLTEMEDRLDIVIEDDEVDGELLETYGNLLAFAEAKRESHRTSC